MTDKEQRFVDELFHALDNADLIRRSGSLSDSYADDISRFRKVAARTLGDYPPVTAPNVYEVCYGSYEDSARLVFTHPKGFSQRQFNRLVIKAIADHVRWMRRQHPMDRKVRKFRGCGMQVSELFYGDLIDRALEKVGFTPVLGVQIWFDGWASIRDSGLMGRKQNKGKPRLFDAKPKDQPETWALCKAVNKAMQRR